jgi:hypothetical protein
MAAGRSLLALRLLRAPAMHTNKNDQQSDARLNVDDSIQVDSLWRAFDCRRSDIYVAAFTVGSRISDIRDYIEKLVDLRDNTREESAVIGALPPVLH